MGLFSKKREEASCSTGAVCAWEYKGQLYKSKEDRDRAERRDRFDSTVAKLALYLEEPSRYVRFIGPTIVDDLPTYMYGDRMGDAFFATKCMTSSQVANKLVAAWPDIRNIIDNIVLEK